jgi:hypothetical protein
MRGKNASGWLIVMYYDVTDGTVITAFGFRISVYISEGNSLNCIVDRHVMILVFITYN